MRKTMFFTCGMIESAMMCSLRMPIRPDREVPPIRAVWLSPHVCRSGSSARLRVVERDDAGKRVLVVFHRVYRVLDHQVAPGDVVIEQSSAGAVVVHVI